LYFFSEETSQHSQDVAQDPRAAAAIYPECHDWREIRGLQLRGNVRRVDRGPEWEAAWALYAAKFPFVGELKDAVARNTLYVFEPNWVRLVDNRKGFGFKEVSAMSDRAGRDLERPPRRAILYSGPGRSGGFG
jgi:uncharacterized protein YhbP (UPF0306 family)